MAATQDASRSTFDGWRAGSMRGDLHRAEAVVTHMHALHAANAIGAAHTLASVVRIVEISLYESFITDASNEMIKTARKD